MEVELKNITKCYGKVPAVQNLSLTVEDGALHFLLGPSGCGKTTTLRMLAGLELPTEGSIIFGGQDVTRQEASIRGIGMVFQNYALWPHMTVRANIEYGLKLRRLSKIEIKKRLDDVLEITHLDAYLSRYPAQLSGGQQQRVALARALAIRPRVLLLDEPLSNLDTKLRLELRDNIAKIHRQTQITTIYVTHDQKEALSLGTDITVMHSGKIVQTGKPRDLYINPQSAFLAGFIGETNLISGKVLERSGDGVRVSTSLGAFRSSNAEQPFRVGDEVLISVRPEMIRLSKQKINSDKSHNSFSLPLRKVTYLGEMEQLELGSSSDSLKVSAANSGIGAWAHVDEDVECYVDDSDVLVFSPKNEPLTASLEH